MPLAKSQVNPHDNKEQTFFLFFFLLRRKQNSPRVFTGQCLCPFIPFLFECFTVSVMLFSITGDCKQSAFPPTPSQLSSLFHWSTLVQLDEL